MRNAHLQTLSSRLCYNLTLGLQKMRQLWQMEPFSTMACQSRRMATSKKILPILPQRMLSFWKTKTSSRTIRPALKSIRILTRSSPNSQEIGRGRKSTSAHTLTESIMLKTCATIATTEKVKARKHMPVAIHTRVTTLPACVRTVTWLSTTWRESRNLQPRTRNNQSAKMNRTPPQLREPSLMNDHDLGYTVEGYRRASSQLLLAYDSLR